MTERENGNVDDGGSERDRLARGDAGRAAPPGDATDRAAEPSAMHDAANATADARSLQPSGAEPSLVARQAAAGVSGVGGASDAAAFERRGRQNAPLSGGRLDDAAATEGASGGARGAAAAGGPVTNVGAPQGDSPAGPTRDERSSRGSGARGQGGGVDSAGILEDVGGRVGGAASGGDLYDGVETGRSIADVAAASGSGGDVERDRDAGARDDQESSFGTDADATARGAGARFGAGEADLDESAGFSSAGDLRGTDGLAGG